MIWGDRMDGYVWRLKKELPERFGHACAIVGGNGSSSLITIEFEDGVQVRAPRTAVRRAEGIQT